METIVAFLMFLGCMQQEEADAHRRKIVEEFRRSDLARQVARLQEYKLALVEARIEAILAIADGRNYTKHSGQEEIERRVAAVRRIWTGPGPAIARLSERWTKLLARVSAQGDPLFDTLRLLAQGPLSFREIPLRFEDPRLAEYNRAVRKYNESCRAKIAKSDWALVEEVNDYREMMGRRVLEISPELCRAAREHAREMKRREVLDHESPTAGGPAVRAATAGFRGGCVGENILKGAWAPEEAHRIWFRSAPHHRNMLVEKYKYVGVGSAGDYWTEMFGTE